MRVKIAVGAVVLVLALAGCTTSVRPAGTRIAAPSSTTASPVTDTFSVVGHLTLSTGWVPTGYSNSGCKGSGGFSDLYEGQQIVVVDGSGATQALGSLYDASQGSGGCVFTFSVPGVPKGLPFYSFKLGTRTAPQYTEAEMESGPELSLG